MNFLQRLILYLFGILLGIFFVYFVLVRGRTFPAWLPGDRVIDEFVHRSVAISTKAQCKLSCLNFPADSIKSFISKAKVDFDLSKVHEQPCKTYILKSKNLEDKILSMSFLYCDTALNLNDIEIRGGEECGCK